MVEGALIGGLVLFILKKIYDIEGKVEKMENDISHLKNDIKEVKRLCQESQLS